MNMANSEYTKMNRCDYTVWRNVDYSTLPVTGKIVDHSSPRGTTLDIAYGTSDMDKHTLDLYMPNAREASSSVQTCIPTPCPVVIYIHGGGWHRGHRQVWRHLLSAYDTNVLMALILWLANVYDNIGEAFARNGIACAVITYPLSCWGFPWNILELLCSCICSTVALAAITGLVSISLYVIPAPYNIVHFLLHQLHQHGQEKGASSVILLLVLLLAWTQILTWVIVALRRTSYRLSVVECLFPVTIVVSVCSPLPLLGLPLLTKWFIQYVVLLVAIQGLLLYAQCSKLPTVKHPDHIRAAAKSVRWVKNFGQTTRILDDNMIILMGYSSGGHLSCLLTFDHKYLNDVQCSTRDIKGVISMSGVFNLECLSRGLLKHLYVYPVFGQDATLWRELSPIRVIDLTTRGQVPPFLLFNAQHDPILHQQTEAFMHKLRDCSVEYEHYTIPWTNHWSIPAAVGKQSLDKFNIEKLCVDFVRNLSKYYMSKPQAPVSDQ